MRELVYFGKMMIFTIVQGRLADVEPVSVVAAKAMEASSDSPSVIEMLIGGVVIAGLLAVLVIRKISQNKNKQDKAEEKTQFNVPQTDQKAQANGETGKKGLSLSFPAIGRKKAETKESSGNVGDTPVQNKPEMPKEVIRETNYEGYDENDPTVDLKTFREQGTREPSRTSEAVRAYVVGVNGSMYGSSFWISEKGVTFGRDSSCDYAYSSEEKTISRFHCILYSADDMLCIMDNGSINGTFLEDGHRLQPKEPEFIRVGSRFYLGTPDNMFEIKTYV